MFYDYVLLTYFILSSVFMALSAFVFQTVRKQFSTQTKQYQALQKKIKTYLNMLYFFLLSIFITRLIFATAFPMQLDQLAIISEGNTVSVVFMLYQALAGLIYLLIVFLLQLNHHIKLIYKYEYLLKVLKFSLYFIGLDLILSVAGWFKYNADLFFPSVLHKSNAIKTLPDVMVWGLLSGVLLFVVIYWLVQRKRKTAIRILFWIVMLLTSFVALYTSYINAGFYWSAKNAFSLFTYKDAAYGWLWFVLILSAVGSQVIAAVMLVIEERFINRYFVINYSVQLNRIALISVLGLFVNALLPQIILWLM